MKRLWFLSMLYLVMFIFLISGCGGGSDKSSSSSSSGSAITSSTSSLTGLVDFSSERSTRADTDQVEGKARLVVDLDSNGIYGSSEDKIYETVIKNGKFSFVNVEVLKDGITKAKLTVEKEGRAPYEEIVELSNGSSVSVKIETKPVEKITVKVNRKVGGYLIFGIKKNPDGTRKAFVKRSTRADDVSLKRTEVGVVVPVNIIPQDVTEVTASLRFFDGTKDKEYFPGEFVGEGYNRSAGTSVQLKSVSFAFMDLKNQNGKDIQFAESSKNRQGEDIKVTLSVPDNTLSFIKDDDPNKPGVQVPLWTYNDNTGTWTYVGEGDLYDSNGNPVDSIPPGGLTGTGYYVIGTITVANWGDYVNLDYPIFFTELKEVTICIETKDQSGNPVSGVYVWGEYDTYVKGIFTDNNGTGRFTIPVNASASDDWIKDNYDFYWQSWAYGYIPNQIDESKLSQSNTSDCDYDLEIIIQNPFNAQIEVTVKDENGNPVANKWVDIWDNSYYWQSKQTNDEGKVIFDVKSETLYSIKAVGLQKNAEVNGSVDNDETSDNGQLATVEFQEQNIAPNVDVYIFPISVKAGTSVTAYIYANDVNGDNLALTSAQLGNSDVLSNCSQNYSYAGYASWTCSLNTTGLADTQTFTAKVSDGKVEASNSATLTIISGNRKPVIYGIEILDSNNECVENWKSLKLNTEYKFVVYAWDPDGDNLNYSWKVSSVNRKTFRNNANNDNTYTYTFTSEGDYEITVTADDGNGGSDTYSTTVHAGNIAPVILGLGIITVNPKAGNPIEVFAYTYDPDGKLTVDSFSWQIDGDSVEPINPQYSGYYYTAQLTLPDEIPGNGYFLVTLTVTDKDNKTATNEFKVWVNNLPVIDSGLPKNLSLKEGESYTFTVVAHDPDGDALEYEWYVNGQKQSETSSSFTYTFEYAGTYEVKCVISDGISSVEIISTVTVSKEANLTNAEKALSDFLNEPTEENYNNLLSILDSLPEDTKEAHLWKAVVTLFKLYRDNKDFFNNLGVGLGTDFNTLRPEEVIYNLLNIASYDQDIKKLLADLVKKLDEVNNELVAAEGVNTSISLTGYDTVYFDDIDVKIMEMLTQFSKAICLYLQAVNFDDVTTWTVNGQDIRELIKNGEEISEEQWKEFFNANSQVFTYSDTSKLDEFKNVFKDAVEKYKDIIAALESLDVGKLKERYQHAFSIDDEADVWRAKAIEKTFDSLIAAFGDPNAEIVVPYEKEKDEQYIDGGDGNYYTQVTFDIYLEHYKPTGKDITIYDIVNGKKSPKDVIDAAGKMDYQAYQPYILYNEELFKENVSETYWDEPIKTYTIPKANITIDGDVSDWVNVPVFYEEGDLQIKLAYDENDNFYVYVYKMSKFEDEFDCWFERWGPSNEDWFLFKLNYENWNDRFSAYMGSTGSWTDVYSIKDFKNNNATVGVEIKFTAGFSKMVQKEGMNSFGINWNYSPLVVKVIKFLPEAK